MKLVVGLGNPGTSYALTRHNVGFMVLDKLATEWTEQKKLKGLVSKQGDVIYLKPLTYMNLSGESVGAAMQFYKIALTDVLIIFDDKDLPLGTVRFRTKGSSGGHNGVKSIIAHAGSDEFARYKIGIAPTEGGLPGDTADYVLAKFLKTEHQLLNEAVERTVLGVHEWLQK